MASSGSCSKPEPSQHAKTKFQEVQAAGDPARPLEFPAPIVARGVRVNALVVDPESGTRQVWTGVIHREDMSAPAPQLEHLGGEAPQFVAYGPRRRLQDAIYGSVWACVVLQRHLGVAADDAARAAGLEPGSPQAPIVWEITHDFVAIKMVEWARVHHMRGRLLEDPIKEVAAMQLIGAGHPHVLGSVDVLQDGDFLYSVMPYCSGGDLFGIVVKYAEESGGDVGMPEPVARFWFRQILWGLHRLQSLGVCHRDLSLENVLVHTENCLIIDMGMCLRVPYNDRQASGALCDVRNGHQRRMMKPQGVCGKHNYMSPEVFANTEAFDGFAIDLWAAGVILYIMLTGFPPYDQASRTDQRFELIANGKLAGQLKSWGIILSDEVGDLMQSMLQLKPVDRLSLAEVLDHPWVTNSDVQGPPSEEPLPFR